MRTLLLALGLLASSPVLAAEDPQMMERYQAQYQTSQTVGYASLIAGGAGFAASIAAGLAPGNPETGAPQLGFSVLNFGGSLLFTGAPVVSAAFGLRGASLLQKMGSPNVRQQAGRNAIILLGAGVGVQLVGGVLLGVGLVQLANEHPEVIDDPDAIAELDPSEIPPLIFVGTLVSVLAFPLIIASYVAAATQLARNRQSAHVDRRPIGASRRNRIRVLGLAPTFGERRRGLALTGTF